MTAIGAAVFTNPDDYRTSMGDASVYLVLTEPGNFNARLTWLKLDHFHTFRGRENVPRIAYMSLAPPRLFVSFPLTSSSVLVWNGIELQLGDIVLHSRGERGHQWMKGTGQWALMSFPASEFTNYVRALSGLDLPDRQVSQILRLPASAAVRLRRLHSRVCHLAETQPEIVAHQEAAHAIEQEFIYTLVNCLTAGDTYVRSVIRRRHADTMIRFEEILHSALEEFPSVSELCTEMGIAERTLRARCIKSLGLSPGRYIRLRQLNLARSELQRTSSTITVAQIAQRYGFSERGRFSNSYRALFGESPSETLKRTRADSEIA